eukprot:CAMPEP_0113519390 /NCGR_PEP_ID=MMETSP0014_2-20120614/43494_1 /TAXON_ID=2857 /ORGANISM="Nitzschia sp." /LENGTH=1295 /DNA_ID=CAMNT_0000417105 /DNA_START=357 /DNA_END=4244 /DNA_ORIENTATION=+ /assembly_acc=CAM_ASM_000159
MTRLSILFLCVSVGQSLITSMVGRRLPAAAVTTTLSTSSIFASQHQQQEQQDRNYRRPTFLSLLPVSSKAAAAAAAASSRSTTTSMKAESLTTESSSEATIAQNSTDNNSQRQAATSTPPPTTTTASPSSGTVILADADDFVKPDRDMYDYRQIRLSNNLEVLLVSTAKSAAGAVVVDHDDDYVTIMEEDESHADGEEKEEDESSLVGALEDETVASTDIDDDIVPTNDGGNDDTSNNNNNNNNGGGNARMEAAAVHIQAGHFDDTIPGLAHFHEHMVFLGTEKYPGEDEYEGFLSKHGGFCNAYTDMEDTNYYFSVTSQQSDPNEVSVGLKGGLDRLAQFFIKPTFEENMVDRELRAIDSEFRNGKTSDSWRNFQLMKTIANQDHPFSNFGCGNYETLTSNGGPPVEELHKFWETYYKTSNMKLSVVGSSSLDALQKTVEETFGQIPHSDDPPRRHGKVNPDSPIFPRENAMYGPGKPAFGEEQLGKIREVIPLLESRTIKIQFLIPPTEDPVLKTTRPHRAISHILGHESPGSLHHLLNDRGYITGLSSGTTLDTSDFSLFSVSLSLTPKGINDRDEILDLVFGWISLIKNTALDDPGLMSKYHNELRQIGETNFKFRESGDPTDFCSSAAELLFEQDIPPGQILFSGVRSDDYDPVVAKEFLKRLTPTNCMITVVNSDLTQEQADEWQVEPLYGAIYRVRDIDQEKMEEWEFPKVDEELDIPALNAYIPTDFSLRCDDAGEPVDESERQLSRLQPPSMVHLTDNFRMWHKMDQFWRVPKTFIRLSIVSPTTYITPRAMSLSRIYQRVLNDDLNSVLYDASLAGANYQISCVPAGYKLSVRGYSEKLPYLLDTLTSRMLSLIEEMKEGKEKQPALFNRFEKAKESLLRETKNYRLDTPYEIANYNSRLLMEENVWYLDDYIDEMEGAYAEKDPLTMEDCALVAEACLTGRLTADALCIGNIDEKGTQEVRKVIEKHFLSKSRPLNDSETPSFRSMKLPTKAEAQEIFGAESIPDSIPLKYQELAYSPSEENNSVEVTLQAGSDLSLGYEGIGILDLIGHIAYSSAYNQLRTREQLGYIVSVYTRKTAGGAWGLTVVVQSSSKTPDYLEERIESWFKVFRQELEEMDADAMAMEARAVVMQLLEDDTKLAQEVGSWWSEIVATETNHESMQTPAFDRIEKLADELNPSSPGLKDVTMIGNRRKTPEELKARVLEFFDRFYSADSPERRAMSSRVFSQEAKDEYEQTVSRPTVFSSYSDMRFLKRHLSTWPVVPYWRIIEREESNVDDQTEEKEQ